MKNENEIKNFIINKNFFHPSYNPDGKNFHHFCEKNDEIIFDYATKLYWQRGGSGNIPYCNFPSHHFRETAISYVEKLKKIEFGGFSDWRIPTLEECLSLFHPEFSFYKSPYSDLPEKSF
jgi:hypothetical protein